MSRCQIISRILLLDRVESLLHSSRRLDLSLAEERRVSIEVNLDGVSKRPKLSDTYAAQYHLLFKLCLGSYYDCALFYMGLMRTFGFLNQ